MTQKRAIVGAAILAAACAGAGGCQQQTPKHVMEAVEAYWRGDYPQAEAILKPDTQKKDESFVLNNCRYGSAALAAGDMTEAENAFYDAYLVINSAKTNDSGRQMASAIVLENFKVWKGEPFECAMAHYYLGLIYFSKAEYGNARAAFENSLFKLKQYEFDKKGKLDDSKTHDVESKFALGYYGLGLTNLKMPGNHHDEAIANFKLAVECQPSLQRVVEETLKPTTNTYLFIDYGQGPRMSPKGWYNEESAFGPTPEEVGPIPAAEVYVDGGTKPMVQMPVPLVDTLALAQEREWQDIDTIRKVKAVVGTGLMAAGTGAAAYGASKGDWGWIGAGLGAMAVGAALSASSMADIRYWEMLPRTVFIIPMGLTPGEHKLVVRAGNAESAEFTITVKKAGDGDSVTYVRLR